MSENKVPSEAAEIVPSNAAGERAATPKEEAPNSAFLMPSLVIFFAFLILDHATKIWAIYALKPRSPIELPVITIIPGLLDLRYAENTGTAFSIMSGQVGLLGLISLVATVAIVLFWRSLPSKEAWGRLALALVLSGAVGNMIDRFARGYVVDFIDAYIGASHWPTFNIADSAICVGAGVLVVRFLQRKI